MYEREGNYGRQPPLIVGVEGAGTVAEVGEGAAEFSVGDRVAWANAPGSYAERVVVGAAAAIPIPNGVSFEVGAAALLQGTTAHYLASSTYPVQPGDTVVVHAAAGGVGLLLAQIVKIRGGRVIATTSTDEKAALARAAGADVVIGYDGFAERVRELTGRTGAAAVYDGVGKATMLAGLEALKPRGMMVLYGAASGQPDPLDLSRLGGHGSLYITRPVLGAYTATRAELLERVGDVFAWIESGELSVRIGARLASMGR